MLKIIDGSIQNLILLPRYIKRTAVIFFDLALCVLCTWLAFYLRLEEIIPFNEASSTAAILSVFFSIPIFWIYGLYREIFRYTGLSIFFSISIAILVYTLVYFSVIGIYVIEGIPRSIGIIQPLLLFFSITFSRLVLKYFIHIFHNSKNKNKNKKKVLIYGAGSAGRQLLASLENNVELEVVGFLDDDIKLHNQIMLGKTIFPQSNLQDLIISKNVNLVLLAMPTISRKLRKKII